MSARRRVVLTGCGLVCAIGQDAESSWRALQTGRTGWKEITRFDHSRHGVHHICGIETVPDTGSYDPGHPLDDASRLLLAAGTEALGKDAVCGDIPAYVATTLGGMDVGTRFYRAYLAGDNRPETARLLKDYMPFMQSRHLKNRFGLRNMPVTVTNACASGANAIGLAFLAIGNGTTRRAIAAGYDVISEFVFGGFNVLRLVSPAPCRPFDVGRAGLTLGEAAAVLVFEEMESALNSGGNIIAELKGYASGSEAYHVTKPRPDGEGARAVMKACLDSAGLTPEEIDSVNAHGTATEQNDLMEARAISSLFGNNKSLTITANKSAVGHTLGAAGVVEAVFAAMSVRDGVVPPTINTEQCMPELNAGELVTGSARRAEIRNVISSSFGFGGTNACLIFSKVPE